MTSISWHQLKLNMASREISFESFNFQIAWQRYSTLGEFEYDYNTPGSEFYLTLHTDSPELNAQAGDVVGWQVKFWSSPKDIDCAPLDDKHRAELVKGLKKSLQYKSNLKTWIICTPGQPSNTKPNLVKDKLLEELAQVNDSIAIRFWNKPIYEAFYHEQPARLNHIFKHYFSSQFIGIEFLRKQSMSRIQVLKEKYDTDLYTSGKADDEIYELVGFPTLLTQCSHVVRQLKQTIKKIKDNAPEDIYEWQVYNTVYIAYATKLLRNLVEMCEKVIESFEKQPSLPGCGNVLDILETYRSSINELGRIVQESKRLQEKANSVEQQQAALEHRHHRYIEDSTYECFSHVRGLFGVLGKATQQVVHVFGNAGFGKTNLACSICETLLAQDIPAVLILGSDLHTGTNLRKQIVEGISVTPSMQFTEFLGALDNLGHLKRVKIPIVIDGLNETVPTAAVWHHELQYMIQDIQEYKHLILITTCRNSYAQQVFGTDVRTPTDVLDSLILEGFDEKNIDEVVNKYFTKYDIAVVNDNYPKDLLKNPLLLKIFARTNRGREVEFTELNVYESIEEYIKTLVTRVSTQNNAINPVLQNNIREGIAAFAKAIWDTNSRGVRYPEDFIKIFDPGYDTGTNWLSTKSYKVQDEGIFICRKMVSGQEYAEFTHDLLGGMCIAKAVVFHSMDPDVILKTLTSPHIVPKLAITGESSVRHPLHEDIIRCIIYLLPKYTDKQIYEVLDNETVAQYTASMLDFIFETESGVESYCLYIDSMDVNRPAVQYFIDGALESILRRGSFKTVPLLVRTLLRMNAPEIDLKWSESVRRRSADVLSYLDMLIAAEDEASVILGDDLTQPFFFISLLLSSTVRKLRDTATRALVQLGLNKRWLLFETFRELSGFADIYVIERLLGALCGVVLRAKDKEFSIDVATFLQDEFLNGLRTTHILILDYIHLILEFAAYSYAFPVSDSCFDNYEILDWQEDQNCRNEITGDGRATFGYGPVRMDFANYTIGSLASRGYPSEEKNTPTLKECLAMVIWRVKELGYSEDLFGGIDTEIAGLRSGDYSSFANRSSIERYGKKYSWIAYFELYGHFMLHKLVTTEYGSGFRVHSVDIDPTFPAKPFKTQLVNACFLPGEDQDIQDWIVQDAGPYLAEFYLHSFPDSESEWVMLRGNLAQEGRGGTRFTIWLDTILVERDRAEEIKDWYSDIRSNSRFPEFFYLFAGEIPWSKNLLEIDETRTGERTLAVPYAFYSWESYHSKCNDIGNVPFVCRQIAETCGLIFEPSCMSYYTPSGELATRFFWDDYSKYLYIRRDVLDSFTSSLDLSLLWIEQSSKYGDFEKHDKTLSPSHTYFQYITEIP